MNISLQNVDKVSALLTVKVEKVDYQNLVDKSLKTLRQKAQIPGFRKGMVPMSLIQKMYRKSVIAEEVNRLLSDKLYGYIRENNLKILGEPMPNEEKQQEIDFDTMEEFEFVFDIALSPEFELKVSGKDKVDYYEVGVTDEVVNEQIKMYTQRNGKYEQVDSYEEKDFMKGLVTELNEQGDPKEGGIRVENATLMPSYIKENAQKALFENAKVNDVVTFNPYKAFEGNDAEIASLLHIEKEEVSNQQSDFSFRIEEITRFVDGELDQNIYDQVFGNGVVNTEEEFRERIKSSIAAQLAMNSDYRFLRDAREVLMKQVSDIELPEALLKRYMALANKDEDRIFVEENYENTVKGILWQLIKEKLVKEYELKVEQADIIAMSKELTRSQFAQYGMLHVPDDILENYAKEMLSKSENVDNIVNRILDMKLSTQLKSKVKLNVRNVSLEEFNKLVN